MTREIAKNYNPKEFETRLYQHWEASGAFRAESSSAKKPFTIAMPPPNATGQLHVGHAVMLALEDILSRWHRMLGDEVLWLPGTDHAAIATENVVLNKIKAEEKIADPRKALGREEVLRRIASYVAESQGTIRSQVRAMGSSCDWSRERYTMDQALNRAVNTTFVRMFEDGLIYRGFRIVNWDPTLQTTISDDEIDYQDTPATLYYLQYGPFVVATSRPETKLGDTAVAVHPDDERYQDQIGQTFEVRWPKGQIIRCKVIASRHIDPSFGSGVLGVTPAHSQVDYQMARENDLDLVQVIGEDGRMLPSAGAYAGLKVLECREAFVKDLEEVGWIVKKEPYQQPLSICYRSKQPIEPLPKEQWFIDVNKPVVDWNGKKQSLKHILIEVVREGKIKIVPDRFNQTYFYWVENLQDWCISRQIWWGHRIPVWYREGEMLVGVHAPEGSHWEQDPDTLDTWFSSALWTWSTLIDPELAKDDSISFEELLQRSPDFQKFHPTQVMETGYDILFFWVARMILMTTYMIREVPFETVYLHGLVRTREGKKMSKSDPKNCIDPLESIDQYGADALRLALVSGTAPGMDLKLYPEKLESCRRFANKIWNAGRFILMNIPEETPDAPPLQVESTISQWLLHRLNDLIRSTQQSLEQFRISDAAESLRSFFWGDFCDWYLEMSKKPQQTPEDHQVLAYAYTTMLKLLHPYFPFVTEALWEHFRPGELLIRAQWPQVCPAHHYPESEAQISLVKEAITQIRTLRDKANLGMNIKIDARLDSLQHAALLEEHRELIKQLARLENLAITAQAPQVASEGLGAYFQECSVMIQAEAVDWGQEIESLKKQWQKEQGFLEKSLAKLNNTQFLSKAPENVIKDLREKVAANEKTIQALQQQIKELEQRQKA